MGVKATDSMLELNEPLPYWSDCNDSRKPKLLIHFPDKKIVQHVEKLTQECQNTTSEEHILTPDGDFISLNTEIARQSERKLRKMVWRDNPVWKIYEQIYVPTPLLPTVI